MTRNSQRASVGACLLLLFSVMPVFAHAELVESDPAQGATIQTPYTLTATFTEELVERSNIVVTNAAGAEVARGEADPEERTLMVVELPELPVGDYVASWTARTADGHAERGQINFTVAPPATLSPTPPSTPDPTPTASSGATAATQTAPPATASPTPAPTAPPTPTDPSAGGGDAVLAVAIGAVAIGALALFLFGRTRR